MGNVLNQAAIMAIAAPEHGNKIHYFRGYQIQGREVPAGFGVRVTAQGARHPHRKEARVIDWNTFAMPTEITDDDLAEAICDKNAEDPRFYRGVQSVINEFGLGGSFNQIRQSPRWEFVGRLGKTGSRLKAEHERNPK